MSTSGLSAGGLARMHDVMAGHVARDSLPGIVVGVHRHGESWVESIGTTAFGSDRATGPETIFRISSMTKPIVAVAAMTLVEDCLVRLDESVDGWLPELANRQVLRDPAGSVDDTIPAQRPITVRDVLTGTMGFGQLYGPPEQFPILAEAIQRGVRLFPPMPLTEHDPDEWLRRLGSLPLMHQPGQQWMYNTPSQVLGVLVARIVSEPLGSVLQDRVFGPLGMTDTGFNVPPDDLARLAMPYALDQTTGNMITIDGAGNDSLWARPPVFPDGAGGLVSTVGDMLAFGQMMLGDGRRDETRLLARPTVAAMTTDQLTRDQKADALVMGDPDTRGWGFGMSVITRRDLASSSPGRFGWDGGFGTSWYADPAENLTAVLMTQRSFGYPDPGIRDDFWTSLYAAIDD